MGKSRARAVSFRIAGRRIVPLLLALCAVAAAASLAALWAAGQQENVATATVMVHPLEGNAYSPGGRGDELVNLETEAQVLRSDAVARGVATRLAGQDGAVGAVGSDGGNGADELLAGLSVAVPPSTQLLEITVRAADGESAAARATAFAETYLEFRRSRTESDIYERTVRLQDLVTAREKERTEAVRRLEQLRAGAPAGILLTQQVQDLTSQIGSLRAQLAAAQAVSRDPGQVVTPGTVATPSVLADPVAMAVLAGGAVAALCLGIVVAGRTRRSVDVVRGTDDLAESGVALIRDFGTRVETDALARFRSEILALGPDRPLIVTVGAAEGGEALLFEELVESFIRARYEVVSVDLTQEETAAAVTSVVLQEAGPAEVLVERRRFLSEPRPVPGSLQEHRTDRLADVAASSGMVRGLAALGKHADVLLVRCDGLRTPVGCALVPASDGVVIEVHPGACTRTEIEDVVAAATRAGTEVIGMALVRPSGSRPRGRRDVDD